MRTLAVVSCATVMLFLGHPTRAAFVETAAQTASGVTITGTGNIDLSELTSAGSSYLGSGGIDPANGNFFLQGNVDGFLGLTGPVSFGSGQITGTSQQAGGGFAIFGPAGYLGVPAGYQSGTTISNTLTFNGATFTTLGLTLGSYTYRSNSGSDVVTLQVGGPAVSVDEPATFAILGLSILGMTVVRRFRGVL